jgi:hypothetical protein
LPQSEHRQPTLTCREPSKLLPRGGGSPRDGSRSGRAARRHRQVGASSFSPAVPQACHSWQSRPVPSGQPRTTPHRPRPVPSSTSGGDDPGRSGFASRGSWVPSRRSLRAGPSTRSRRTTSSLVTWGHTGTIPDRIPADNTGKQRLGVFTGQCLYRASCPR